MKTVSLTPEDFSSVISTVACNALPPVLADLLAEYVHEVLRNAEDRAEAGINFTEAGEIVADVLRLWPGTLNWALNVPEVIQQAFDLNLGEGSEPDEQIAGMVSLAFGSPTPLLVLGGLEDVLRDVGHALYVSEEDLDEEE